MLIKVDANLADFVEAVIYRKIVWRSYFVDVAKIYSLPARLANSLCEEST